MIDETKVKKAIADLLDALGVDKNSEGLIDTPSRVARMYSEILKGYNEDAAAHLAVTFSENSDVVLEQDIEFSSTCEHHLMPFFGKVHVAYIPNGKVVGLSKLARVVDVYSRRFQLQERMNAQIADAIFDNLSPIGVVVVVEGEHTCMTARGVKKVGSKTVTYAVRGDVPQSVLSGIFSIVGRAK